MTTKHYLFIFSNDNHYDMICGASLKDAVWEMAKDTGEATEMLQKCLRGYDNDDIAGIVGLFNHFAYTTIEKIYIVDEVIYPSKS